MLVLSRRENQKIVFPSLDISVDVVRVAGRVVRIGVEAPRDVRVLRGELAENGLAPPQGAASQGAASREAPAREAASHDLAVRSEGSSPPGALSTPGSTDGDCDREKRHALRNRLNRAMLGLQVLQMQLEQASVRGADQTVSEILESLEAINRDLTPAAGGSAGNEANDSPSAWSEETVPRKALIVDDSRNEAELMAQILELHGYRIEIVENGREAITWLRENPHPDVVLMDMNMPEMGGAEAIRLIREDRVFDRLRVFGVSGLEQKESGVEGGIDRWFTKPVRADRLIRAIDQTADSTAV